MHARIPSRLFENVRTQARLRAWLGMPLCLLMLFCVWRWGPASPLVRPAHVIPVFLTHMAYSLAALYMTRPSSRCDPRHVAGFTAVMDPLLLSGCLMLMGQAGQLFACIYLFVILGYGFRIGMAAMTVCQLASIIGFITMAMMNPAWHRHPLAVMSVLLTLSLVPLYARALVRRLQAACEQAEAESQAKTRLLATVSHELRTPLVGIISSAQLMQEENGDAQVRRRADTVLALSADLLAQIDDLLDSAKYGAGAVQLARQPFRMPDVADHLRRVLGPIARAKGIRLQVAADGLIPATLLGDMQLLCRVLLNLGSNAVKFTDHGEVSISLARLDCRSGACRILFSCKDTGIGIAPDLHEQIFEPFFQASGGAGGGHSGTGLGMSIARDIVKRMGGDIRISSTPGRGSLFEFDIWFDQLHASAAGPGRGGAIETVRNKRILLADDNATSLMLMRELLERDGHQVLTAASGRDALRLLGDTLIDLAFLDFNMGDIDGARALQIYRFGKLDPAPAYILTADNTSATTRHLLDSGAAGVLHKPVGLDALRRAVSQQFVGCPAPEYCAPINARDAWIDESAIESLRELGTDDDLVCRVINAALTDIRLLSAALATALEKPELKVIRDKAHALKGIGASVGAVQLAMLAARLVRMDAAQLERERLSLIAEVGRVSMQSIDALRGIVQPPAG